MSERIRSGSAPQIHKVSGFGDEHVAIAPLSRHGTAGDPRTPRAATDAFGLAAWLEHNERSTWKPIAGRFLHFCQFVEAIIDEHMDEILQCRCYSSGEFLGAQDRRAVAMDARRA